METLLQDIRFALRQLARNPGFAVVALATLAIGIGANTAIFSVLNAVLIRPLPFERPEELVQIRTASPEYAAERNSSYSHFGVNVLNFEEYRTRSSTIEEMGYLTPYDDDGKIHISGGVGGPEQVWAWGVSPSLFAALGVQPMLGRVFLDEERAPPGYMRWTEVAILSHRLWQHRFGADPEIIGKTVTLDAGPSTVVGVMPPEFELPPIASSGTVLHRRADVYVPMYYQAHHQPRRFHQVAVIGRLAPGVALQTAQEELTLLQNGLKEAYPEAFPVNIADWSIVVSPVHAVVADNYGGGLYLLMGAVGLVLLIVCGNVANLLIVRGSARSSEIAVRLAIGGGRRRLVRQLLTETMVLALVGGGIGVLFAVWGTDLMIAMIPADVPRAADSGLDARVLVFAVGLSLLTGLLFGLLPALRASTSNPIDGLKIGMTGRSGGRGAAWGSQMLVVGQVTIAVVLLIGAGLLAKSFLRLQSTERGYAAQNVLVVSATFGAHHLLTNYNGNPDWRTPERMAARVQRGITFFQQAIEELRRLPGVESVAAGAKPLSGARGQFPLRLEGETEPRYYTLVSSVSPDYFSTMGIPLLGGQPLPEYRSFDDAEQAASNWSGGCEGLEEYCVVIVSETLARTVWPGEDPIGKRIGLYDCCQTVIGVAGDVTFRGVDAPPPFREFDPAFHVYMPSTGRTFLLRTAADPASLIGPVRRALMSLEPEGVLQFSTLEDDIAASLARPRFYMMLIGLFAAVAVGLAMVGLYGVIAFAVAQRTREIGLRMALGAERVDVLSLVIRQGMGPLLLGILVGVAAATTLSRLLTGFLYGMEPVDPTVFAILAVMVTMVGLLATYIPARRASKVAPMEALRYE